MTRCYNLGPTLSGQYLLLPRLVAPLPACCYATITMTHATPPFSIQWPNNTILGNRQPPLPSIHDQRPPMTVPQPYDYFLVLDVEATCFPGTGFHWPNEIIVRYCARGVLTGSIVFRNGPFVSSDGWTKGAMAWPVPCKRSQNSVALSGQHGVLSYPPSVPLSPVLLKSVFPQTIITTVTPRRLFGVLHSVRVFRNKLTARPTSLMSSEGSQPFWYSTV